MKRLCLISLILIFVVSCRNDDDQIIAVCDIPTNLSVSNITHDSAELAWGNSNDELDVKIEYGITGFTPGTGTIITVTENTLSINNLEANTSYDFYVQALCDVDNLSMVSDASTFNTLVTPVIPEFLPNLSDLNIFIGDLKDLNFSPNVIEYELSTKLHTDYALKQRLLALPLGTSMEYDGDGLPIFPEGSVLAKTFYYNLDETNLNLGKKIIETRILIKQIDSWIIGNYYWNEDQTDAVLDQDEHIVPVTWINSNGEETSIDYEVPDNATCIMCHQTNGDIIPIGPKLRSMNFDVNGNNQLQKLITDGHLKNAPVPSLIGALPNWEDDSYSDEIRTRAYFDVNCAHCHSPGGYHNITYSGNMDFRFETSFEDSQIYEKRYSILSRFLTSIPGYSMPFVGVTLPHQEAIDLITPYLESLE